MAQKNWIEEEDDAIKRLTSFKNKIMADKVVVEDGVIKKVSLTLSELKDFAAIEEKIIDIRRKRLRG